MRSSPSAVRAWRGSPGAFSWIRPSFPRSYLLMPPREWPVRHPSPANPESVLNVARSGRDRRLAQRDSTNLLRFDRPRQRTARGTHRITRLLPHQARPERAESEVGNGRKLTGFCGKCRAHRVTCGNFGIRKLRNGPPLRHSRPAPPERGSGAPRGGAFPRPRPREGSRYSHKSQNSPVRPASGPFCDLNEYCERPRGDQPRPPNHAAHRRVNVRATGPSRSQGMPSVIPRPPPLRRDTRTRGVPAPPPVASPASRLPLRRDTRTRGVLAPDQPVSRHRRRARPH
jgi:hypothetical protein